MKWNSLLTTLFLMLSANLCLFAQTNTRLVKGSIQDENGRPKADVVITTDMGNQYKPEEDGSFEIRVPFQCRFIVISAQYYFDGKYEIDGSYILARLKKDKDAEGKARKEAEAKAKEEEIARQKAEKERLAAEEKARKEAETKAKKEKASQAPKKTNPKAKESAAPGQFKTKGLEHSISLSYGYQLGKGTVKYQNSGSWVYYGLHPYSLKYSLAYMFNQHISVGAGAGVMFNALGLSIDGDTFSSEYGPFEEKRLCVPVFAEIKYRPLKSKVRPVVDILGGYYLLSNVIYGEGAVGCEYRFGRNMAVNACVTFSTTPYPVFKLEENTAYYGIALTPGVKIGFTF